MKRFAVLLLMAMLFSAGCAAEEMLPVFTWQRDLVNHWQLNEDGEATGLAPHTLDDALVCTECGSEIYVWDDSGDIHDYDEMGNLLRSTSFDENGEVVTEILHQLTYSEDGVLLLDLEYVDGVFCGEYVYRADDDGMSIPVRQTFYHDDGTFSVNEYDEFGNMVYAVVYEADGTWIVESFSEYEMVEDGWFYEAKSTTRYATGESFHSEHNVYGDVIRHLNAEADGTVWSDTVYEYGYLDGVRQWKKQYSFGKLTFEETYDEAGCLLTEKEYLEDGGYIVWIYDAEGECTETTYDADGNPAEYEN